MAEPMVMVLKTKNATHWGKRTERVLVDSPVSTLMLGSMMYWKKWCNLSSTDYSQIGMGRVREKPQRRDCGTCEYKTRAASPRSGAMEKCMLLQCTLLLLQVVGKRALIKSERKSSSLTGHQRYDCWHKPLLMSFPAFRRVFES